MAEFEPVVQKFFCDGLWTSRPADSAKFEQFPFVQNLRSYQEGVLQSRAGTSLVGSVVASPAHSLRRIICSTPESSLLVAGAGSTLSTGPSVGPFTPVTDPAGGSFSTNPWYLTPFRPERSPVPWMYIGDSGKMRKLRYDGAEIHQVGLPPPASEPSSAIISPARFKMVDPADDKAGWWSKNPDFAVDALTAYTLINTTIFEIVYDNAPTNTGWASIYPGDLSGMAEGLLLHFNSLEYSRVAEIFRGTIGTAVETVIYDNAPTNTGVCTIVPRERFKDVGINQLVDIGGAKYRILSVDYGDENEIAIRIDTGATEITSGEILQFLPTIRCYLYGTFVNTDPITTGTIGLGGWIDPTKNNRVGYIQKDITIDLSVFESVGGDNPPAIQPSDLIHLSLLIDRPSLMVEARLMFDLDPDPAVTTDNMFTKEYYYVVITPDDYEQALDNDSSTLRAGQEAIRRSLINGWSGGGGGIRNRAEHDSADWVHPDINDPVRGDNSRPPTTGRGRPIDRTRFQKGQRQFSHMSFPVSSFTRVGSEPLLGWKDVVRVRVQINVTDKTNYGTGLGYFLGPICVTGGKGPDSGSSGMPYYYRYRGRCSETGVAGNFSPALKLGVIPRRQEIVLTVPAHPADEADKLDFERYGGTVPNWMYIGSCDNDINRTDPVTYTDNLDDLEAVANAVYSEGQTNFQPFPITGARINGTCEIVAGSALYDSAGLFPLDLAPGNRIRVGKIYYTTYKVQSAKVLLLNEAAVAGTDVDWSIETPVYLGRTPDAFFGPLPATTQLSNVFFGLKDGTLWRTKGNNPDSTMDTLYLEVTGPSEPLMNGCIYNGRAYIWSTERMFQIIPTGSGGFGFEVSEIPSGRGLISRWALCHGRRMYWISKDGVYASEGGAAQNISDERLGPLFNVEGQSDTSVNGIPAIAFPYASAIRLSSTQDGYIYLDYMGTTGNITLVYEEEAGRWWTDKFTGMNATFHYGDEPQPTFRDTFVGGSNGSIYRLSGNNDPGGGIAVAFQTGAFDLGNTRTEKLWGDFTLDLNSQSQTVTITPYADITTALFSTTTSAASRAMKIIDMNTGAGYQARNLALRCSVTSSASPVVFYQWQPMVIQYPEHTIRRGTDFTDEGYMGRKYVRAIIIEADTYNVARTIRMIKDGRAVAWTQTVQHNGRTELEYGVNTPFSSYLLGLLPDDANEWQLYKWGYVYDKLPNISDKPTSWMLGEDARAKFVQGFLLVADSDGQAVTFDVQSDSGVVQQTFTYDPGAYHGRLAIPFSFTTPFITHHVRIVPTAGQNLGIDEQETKWIWEPEPELAVHWETQQTDLDIPGYKHLRALYVSLISSATSTLLIRTDGASTSITIPSTAGARRKYYLPLPPLKGKVFEFAFTSASPMRVYQRELELFAKGWGSTDPYQRVRPFGDEHRSHGGALI